jgi:hypothetical protein
MQQWYKTCASPLDRRRVDRYMVTMRKKGPKRTGKPTGRNNAFDDFATTSTSIVHTAAEILEREIEAWIKAAQEIGTHVEMALEKTLDSTPASFLEIIDRFEKDGLEAVSVLAALHRTLAKAGTKATDPGPGQDNHND